LPNNESEKTDVRTRVGSVVETGHRYEQEPRHVFHAAPIGRVSINISIDTPYVSRPSSGTAEMPPLGLIIISLTRRTLLSSGEISAVRTPVTAHARRT